MRDFESGRGGGAYLLRYRAEVDGLRAVAVLAVVFFHAGFEIFRGGFVGVDVFFVISGFLIASIIAGELDKGTFSLLRFYERRARRILPALFFITAACIPLAWLWLAPRHMEGFAESIIAVATFWSNFLFWNQSGYFDTANELKPLIHTWSLAVEEQYYILFPLCLMLLWRLSTRKIVMVLSAVAVVSLGIAHWGAYAFPTASFYLLPTRVWEFLIGVLAALYLRKKSESAGAGRGNAWLSLLGLGMIALAVFAFDRHTPFPSLYALVPTAGTALILLFATPGTPVHRVLSGRLVVGIGLISYSVYLWHQPLLAFYRHWSLSDPTLSVKVTLCVASVVLGYLTWRLVEQPFRNRQVVAAKSIAYAAPACGALLVGLGVAGLIYKPPMEIQVASEKLAVPHKFGGIEIDGEDCSFPKLPDEYCRIEGERAAPENEISLFVIGDSHARVLTEAVYEDRSFYTEFFDLTAGGCPFLLGLTVFIGPEAHRCDPLYQQRRLEFLTAQGRYNKVAVLAARWPLYLYGDGFDNSVGGVERRDRIIAAKSITAEGEALKRDYFQSLEATMQGVLAVTDYVVFVLPTHTNGWNVPDKVLRLRKSVGSLKELEEKLALPSAVVAARLKEFNDFVDSRYGSNPKVSIVDPRKFTCSEDVGLCYGVKDKILMFADSDHLSLPMNERLSTELAGLLTSLYGTNASAADGAAD